MKITITKRIVLSNLLIILITLICVAAIFNITAKGFLEAQARKGLLKDAHSISELIEGDINHNEFTEKKIRQLIKDRIALRTSLATIESKYAIVGREGKVLLPRNNQEAEYFKAKILPLIGHKLVNAKQSSIKFTLDKTVYMAVLMPVTGEIRPVVKGWVVLYTPVAPVHRIVGALFPVLLVSLLFTGLAAVLIGVFFARSIAKPVIILKNRAEKLAKRDFDSKAFVNTGDELEELAVTIDKMAVELKEYDSAQRNFLQNASHELKTPLMSIQGYAEGLRDGVFEDKDKALKIISEESSRLKGIVDDIIFLSKLETMEDFNKYAEESLNDIIGISVEKVNSLAVLNSISIKQVLSEDVRVIIDKDKFVQALINILGNCIRHAKEEIVITSVNRTGYVEIYICDDGEGFSKEDTQNIFKRFYKGKKGNTGLGLAITKAIIEKQKGEITASNATNGGAMFKIMLPK